MQTVLVDTERNAQGAQLQNASACTFFQLQNEEHNSFWLGKQFKTSTTKSNASEVKKIAERRNF